MIFSSYPDEKATCEEAQECVAKLACEALTEKHVGSDNSSPEPLDDLLIIERVADVSFLSLLLLNCNHCT